MLFSTYAEVYDVIYGKKDYRSEIDFIFQHLESRNLGNVLEIGCGTGNFTFHLSKWSEKIIALDPSIEMLSIASKKEYECDTEFVKMSIRDLISGPKNFIESFDSIFCLFHVLSYIDLPQAKDFFRKLSESSPGTNLVIDFWDSNAVLSTPPRETTVRVCDGNGNEVVRRISPINNFDGTDSVNLSVSWSKASSESPDNFESQTELHVMHHFSLAEMLGELKQSGFLIVAILDTQEQEVFCGKNYGVTLVAQRSEN